MVATALAFKLQRNKSISAISTFISTVSYDQNRGKSLMAKQSETLEIMQKEIIREIMENHKDNSCLNKEQLIIAEVAPLIFRTKAAKAARKYQAILFLKKCKRIEAMILTALLLGIIGAVICVLGRNVVDAYIFCFIVWILSCFSLWVTLRIIEKDWKENCYGKKSKN